MSERPTQVTEELYEYLLDNFSSENEVLAKINKAAKVKGMPVIQISGVQGKFLQFFLKSIKAKNVLEIGTLGGYSAITMAQALSMGSKLVTVERDPDYADFARLNVENAGLSDIVTVINQEGREFANSYLPDEPLDFIFIDADKPGYYHYLTKLTPHLRSGGIFAADNAFAFGYLLSTAPERDPEDIKSMRSFNEAFRNHPEYFVTLVPIGDGIIMGVKK